MPILLHTLEQDRMDADITKAILDTLINLCNPATHSTAKTREENHGLQFTDIFLKSTANVTLLLTILTETDFHIRYNAIELLKILVKNNRRPLQDSILASPFGIPRLMDLLVDPREVIRNEGVLLLIELTEQNPDIQKIAAFEEAFQRSFRIIKEEGGCDGDVVVQDCLQLIQNLLRDNVSNQVPFHALLSRSVHSPW